MTNVSKVAVAAFVAILGASSTGAVHAAGTSATAGTLEWNVNGISSQVRTLHLNGQELVSVSDAARALGASVEVLPKGAGVSVTLGEHTVILKASSAVMQADGKNVKLSAAVQSWKNTNFVPAQPYVQALGGMFETSATGVSIQTLQLLESADTAQWAGNGRLIASVSNENGRVDYLVNATTGEYQQLLSSSSASDLVVSPDGSKATFVEEDGTLYTVDLTTLALNKVSLDKSIKSSLQWSADGTKIYFLQTDKTNVIAVVDVATGVVTKVLDDKVDYKGDLSVNGNGLTYSVTKPGVVTADSNKAVDADDVAIDDSQTNPQLFDVDLSKTPVAAVQLTKTLDEDKIFINRASNGTVYYVKAGDEKVTSKLIALNAGVATVAFDKEDVS